MTNTATPTPTRGVVVELDKARHLRYSLRTRREMLEEFGGEEEFQRRINQEIGKVLWYGLRHEDPDLTLDAIEEMVDMENAPYVLELMLKAMGYKGSVQVEGGANPPAASDQKQATEAAGQ